MVFKAISKNKDTKTIGWYCVLLMIFAVLFVSLVPGSKTNLKYLGIEMTIERPSTIGKIIGKESKFEAKNNSTDQKLFLLSASSTYVTVPISFLTGNQYMKKIGESHDGNNYYYLFEGSIPPGGMVSGLSKEQINMTPIPRSLK